MDVPVVVTVSDKYLWCLKPFSYLFNKYWSTLQHVIVAGYETPTFYLPPNFEFISIRKPQYDKDHWVDGLIDIMPYIRNSYFVLLLEDYWIYRTVDCGGVSTLADYMYFHSNVIRMDLTADRLYAGGVRDIGCFGHYDIVEAKKSPYQMSLQAGIWNKKLLHNFMVDWLPSNKHSAWQFEIEGSEIFSNRESETNISVVGTRQWPLRYVNAMNNSQGFNITLDGMNEEDQVEVRRMIPEKV